MTPTEALKQHRQICDELYQLTLEENRHMQEHRLPPDKGLLDRKKALSLRLDESLEALRATPSGGARGSEGRQLLEKTRERIMQILQLDRENEQLLTRYSLGNKGGTETPQAPQPGLLKKIYARKS